MKYKAYLNGVVKAEELSEPEYTFTGLAPSTEYTIQFSAVEGGVEGPLSVATKATTLASTVVPTGVTISPKTMNLKVGNKRAATFTVAPTDATDKTDKTAEFTSSKPAVASVDADGQVTALTNGTTTIKVTTNSGAKEDTCAVTVTTDVTGVTVTPTTKELEVGLTQALTPNVAPATASVKTVTYTSSAPEVASVTAEGLVTALTEGSADITVKTTNGNKTAVCEITVVESA